MVDILAPQVSSWQGLGVHKQKQGGHPPLFGSHVMTNITLDHQLGCIEKGLLEARMLTMSFQTVITLRKDYWRLECLL